MTTVYSLEEVAKHNTKDDLWMSIHDKVYNVTEFVQEHPGGEEVLLDEAGKDATESFEDIGHSDEAREILEKYLVGQLDEASKSKTHKFNVIRAGELPEPKKSSGSSLRVIIPALIVIGAIAYKYVLAPQSH
ncbi:cytochrome b5-like heme/steroid binding domain-containing protein [Gilbertella persicaria]|uniref:cytochrome b5-like heme/steroid binding domain-containing protein n=1 Tax=Gilbertella persicaria TaxID=101096 RepID=UPI0022210D42|nr:cytochrome b5-like heme/steroid binding domain-containing protein [Gilbertella persicaria]KAI8066272.1 cytochrome b5-like heme/steroid binding domain-containing protein [Gilbertella persicaria]